MNIQFITLFPEMFDGVLSSSILGRARTKKLVNYSLINLRDFGLGSYRQVDDTPYGGGQGMLLRPEPIVAAIEHAKKQDKNSVVVLPTPRGKIYDQADADKLAKLNKGLIIICPRYEGYDERITNWVDYSFCIGEYVLTGGELPSMVIADSVVRLLPGVLGNEESAKTESFQNGAIEYPQYTRPQVFRDLKTPDVLLSGDHAKIDKWRRENSA